VLLIKVLSLVVQVLLLPVQHAPRGLRPVVAGINGSQHFILGSAGQLMVKLLDECIKQIRMLLHRISFMHGVLLLKLLQYPLVTALM
jgi:hypothetical protein